MASVSTICDEYCSFKNSYFHRIVDSWTVSRVKFALVTINTHLGVVLRGIWAGLVIFSLSMELSHLVDLSHCA